MVRISAFQAEDPGSNPGRCTLLFFVKKSDWCLIMDLIDKWDELCEKRNYNLVFSYHFQSHLSDYEELVKVKSNYDLNNEGNISFANNLLGLKFDNVVFPKNFTELFTSLLESKCRNKVHSCSSVFRALLKS